MRLFRAAALVSAFAILALGACNKPAAEPAPEVHDADAIDADHSSAPSEVVVTMEQAVADARTAAEAPAAAQPVATPVLDVPASGVPATDARAHASAAVHVPASTESAPAPAASGH